MYILRLFIWGSLYMGHELLLDIKTGCRHFTVLLQPGKYSVGILLCWGELIKLLMNRVMGTA